MEVMQRYTYVRMEMLAPEHSVVRGGDTVIHDEEYDDKRHQGGLGLHRSREQATLCDLREAPWKVPVALQRQACALFRDGGV